MAFGGIVLIRKRRTTNVEGRSRRSCVNQYEQSQHYDHLCVRGTVEESGKKNKSGLREKEDHTLVDGILMARSETTVCVPTPRYSTPLLEGAFEVVRDVSG